MLFEFSVSGKGEQGWLRGESANLPPMQGSVL